MIIELLLNPLFELFFALFTLIPNVVLDIKAATWLATVADFIGVVCYFIPVGAIGVILGCSAVFMTIRCVVALITTIWNLIPLL